MSAFNDYCVVCDQLIPQSPEGTKTVGKKNPYYPERLLYCSEDCRQKDESLIEKRLESLEVTSNNCAETTDDPESLIKSPLLLPIDHCMQIQENEEESGGSYCLKNMVSSSTISIPRLSLQPPTPNSSYVRSYDSIYVDHIAERNYQLWLNQHH